MRIFVQSYALKKYRKKRPQEEFLHSRCERISSDMMYRQLLKIQICLPDMLLILQF